MKHVVKEKLESPDEKINTAILTLSADDQTDSNRVIRLVSVVNGLVGNQRITVDSRLFESCAIRIRYALRELYGQSAQNLNQETYQSFKQVCGVATTFVSCFEQSQSIQEEYFKTLSLANERLVRLAKHVINDNKSTIQSKGDSEEQKRIQMDAYVELVSSTPIATQKRQFVRMAIDDAMNFNTDNASLDSAEFFGMVHDISKLLSAIGTNGFETIAQDYCRSIRDRLANDFVQLTRSSDVDSYQSFLRNCQSAIEFLLLSRIKQSDHANQIINKFNDFVNTEDIHRKFHELIKRQFGGNAKNIAMKTLEHFSMALQDLCILYKGRDVRLVDSVINQCATTVQAVDLRNTDIERKNPKEIRWLKKFDQVVLYQESQHKGVRPLPPILQNLCTAAQTVLRLENAPTLSNPQRILTENFQSGCRAYNDSVDALKKSRLEVLSEHLLEYGIRLDIVIRTLDHKLAYLVEVDGPQHFDALGKLRRRDEFTLEAATQELLKLGYLVNTLRVKSGNVNSIPVNEQSINSEIMSAYPHQIQKPRESEAKESKTEKQPRGDATAPGTKIRGMLDASSVHKKSKSAETHSDPKSSNTFEHK